MVWVWEPESVNGHCLHPFRKALNAAAFKLELLAQVRGSFAVIRARASVLDAKCRWLKV